MTNNSYTHLSVEWGIIFNKFDICYDNGMKRYITLIELLVALLLAAVLYSGLFGFYSQMNKTAARLDSEREETEEWLFMQARLAHCFNNLVCAQGSLMNKGNQKYFFFEDNALVFSYNSGHNKESPFSGTTLGKIELNDNKLILRRWPLPLKKPLLLQKEVLIEKTTSMQLFFYEKGEWQERWPFDKKSAAPEFIKLELQRTDSLEPSIFVFQLNNGSSHKVSYNPERV